MIDEVASDPTRRVEPTRAVADRASSTISLLDAGLALVLLVAAVWSRLEVTPTDGLFRDDAWVVAAATHGSAGDLHWIAWGHPGFTAALMAIQSFAANDVVRFAYPALIAGVVAPPILYLALRRLRSSRAVAFILAAALVASATHVQYSGRVKPYVIDFLVVLGLTLALPRLARARWGVMAAVAWLAASLVLSSISGFCMVATAVAGVVLVLYASGDRVLRGVAVAAQLVCVGAYSLVARTSYDVDGVTAFWRDRYDAYPDLSVNPVRVVVSLVEHATRVTSMYPGGPQWVALLTVGAACAGLVIAARRGGDRIRARYLLLLLVAAAVAGLAEILPFGPEDRDRLDRGSRASLWLLPIVAFGLAALAEPARRAWASRSGTSRTVMNVVLFAGAAVLLVAAVAERAPRYPTEGSETATGFVESEVDPSDVVLMFGSSMYEYAATTRSDVALERAPDRYHGFVAGSRDPRVHVLDEPATAEIEAAVGDADRVLLYAAILGFSNVNAVRAALEPLGFEETDVHAYGGYEDAAVWVFER